MDTVYVDYSRSAPVAGMVIGGMTVAERVLRDAARSGASRAIVRGDGAVLPSLAALPLAVEIVGGDTAVPAHAAPIDGDVVAGVKVSDEASRRRAAHALFQTCRRPYDGLGDRYVIRAVSLRMTSLFCRLGLTPNQVTSANILIGLAACYAAALGTALGFVLAGALMFVQVVLDSSDGELARIRHMHSRFGMWLDNTSDDVIDNLFLAALGIGMGGTWMWIGVGAAALRGFVALWTHTAVALMGKPGDVLAFKWWFDGADETLAERFDTKTSFVGVLRSVGRRDLYCLIYAASCMATVPVAGLFIGVANAIVHFALLVAHVAITAGRGRS
ncbi:MAG: CDP-alcohol phosphatidyltransferase family protein [Deltaproteobacteria bacterium]|nr:CDP-alcohol phosphatidyltransferase family protein [Deltaproteobacteria bacterium]